MSKEAFQKIIFVVFHGMNVFSRRKQCTFPSEQKSTKRIANMLFDCGLTVAALCPTAYRRTGLRENSFVRIYDPRNGERVSHSFSKSTRIGEKILENFRCANHGWIFHSTFSTKGCCIYVQQPIFYIIGICNISTSPFYIH